MQCVIKILLKSYIEELKFYVLYYCILLVSFIWRLNCNTNLSS